MDTEELSGSPSLLEVSHLRHYFPVKRGVLIDRVVADVQAVDDVSFVIPERETLGLVGESGCGKSTLARVLLGLLSPTAGTVRFRGEDVRFGGRNAQVLRREIQMVFQDPQGSLNPRLTRWLKLSQQVFACGACHEGEGVSWTDPSIGGRSQPRAHQSVPA